MKINLGKSKMKTVIVSGYFSPIHQGHVIYLRKAKELAGPDGTVCCIVNNDQQQILKTGYSYCPISDRVAVISAIKFVDSILESIDTDCTVCRTLELLCKHSFDEFYFVNGGERNVCPEESICKELGINIVYNVGEQIHTSARIITESMQNSIRYFLFD